MADSPEVITVAEFADWLQALHITLPACKRGNSLFPTYLGPPATIDQKFCKILGCKPWLTQFVSSFGWVYNFGGRGRGVGGGEGL